MIELFRLLPLGILLCGTLALFGRQDTIPLQPVEVLAPKEKDDIAGGKIDSQIIRHLVPLSMESYLEKFSPVFLRRSGAGGSVMASYQGFNPSQVPVLWNGFMSNNGMTGVTDLSLYAPASGLSLQWGNSSLESQGITDALSMEQSWSPDSLRLVAGITAGSFGLVSGRAEVQQLFPNAGWQGSIMATRARNNFPYSDYTVIPSLRQRQEHAAYKKVVLSQGFRWNSRNYLHQLKAAFEGYYNDREIPPSLLSPGNRATQQDAGLRSMLHWQYAGSRWQYALRAGYFFSRLWYDDQSLARTSDNTTHQLWLKDNFKLQWTNRIRTEMGADIGWEKVLTNNYKKGFSEWQVHPWLAQHFSILSWLNFTGKVKAFFVRDFDPAVTGLLSVHGRLAPRTPVYYFLEGKRTTRFPTLNDRFWQPGGNPDVEQENAWTVQGGLRLDGLRLGRSWELDLFVKGFHIRARDLIFWFPGNKIYWTPQNLQVVHSSGAECSAGVHYKKQDWKFSAGMTWQMTAITNEKALSTGDNSVGKQLIYTPRQMLKGYTLLAWKGWSLLPDIQWYDKRYITTDNLSFLQAYALFNIQAGYRHDLRNGHALQGIFSLGNLSNTAYEEVAYKPMPGINFHFSILYFLTHN